MRYFFCGPFVFFVSCVSHAFASVYCTLWSPAWKGLTSWLLLVIFDVFIFTFPCGIQGQVRYLIVSFPDLFRLSYFAISSGFYFSEY